MFFAKTLDDRFVIKQVTRTELLSFLEFGPDYFKYLADALSTGAPTCLAKTLGIYQVRPAGSRAIRLSCCGNLRCQVLFLDIASLLLPSSRKRLSFHSRSRCSLALLDPFPQRGTSDEFVFWLAK